MAAIVSVFALTVHVIYILVNDAWQWQLTLFILCQHQSVLSEDVDVLPNVSKKASMLAGARRHLEAGHEKYILDTIHNHAAQVCHPWYCVMSGEG